MRDGAVQMAVSGYYGCGNAGDEAVLAGIKTALLQRGGEAVRLVVLSQNPAETERLHRLPSVERMNISAIRHTLHQSRLLLSGGGSLLQDATSMRSLLYYLWVARMAYSHGVPFMFYAQGLGPLRRHLSRTLVRIVANRAAYITVRDESSAKLLTAIGVTRPPVEVTADPAFALMSAPPLLVDALIAEEGLPTEGPRIGVSLRPWGGVGESPLQDYTRLLLEMQRQCAARIVLLPMHLPGDVTFAEEIARRTGSAEAFPILRRPCAPEVLLGLVSRMDAIVAMRLHALIFAARVGTPLFALSYDPKVESLMRGLGLADSLESWRGFDPEEVAGRVAGLLSERAARSAALRMHTAELEQRALRNADRALALIQREEGRGKREE
jgi:polysaccharide pyruvyl transferase CsaB